MAKIRKPQLDLFSESLNSIIGILYDGNSMSSLVFPVDKTEKELVLYRIYKMPKKIKTSESAKQILDRISFKAL